MSEYTWNSRLGPFDPVLMENSSTRRDQHLGHKSPVYGMLPLRPVNVSTSTMEPQASHSSSVRFAIGSSQGGHVRPLQ